MIHWFVKSYATCKILVFFGTPNERSFLLSILPSPQPWQLYKSRKSHWWSNDNSLVFVLSCKTMVVFLLFAVRRHPSPRKIKTCYCYVKDNKCVLKRSVIYSLDVVCNYAAVCFLNLCQVVTTKIIKLCSRKWRIVHFEGVTKFVCADYLNKILNNIVLYLGTRKCSIHWANLKGNTLIPHWCSFTFANCYRAFTIHWYNR